MNKEDRGLFFHLYWQDNKHQLILAIITAGFWDVCIYSLSMAFCILLTTLPRAIFTVRAINENLDYENLKDKILNDAQKHQADQCIRLHSEERSTSATEDNGGQEGNTTEYRKNKTENE